MAHNRKELKQFSMQFDVTSIVIFSNISVEIGSEADNKLNGFFHWPFYT